MYFDNFSDVIAMGGHGFYVWLSYGVAVMVVAYNIVVPIKQKNDVIKRLRRNLKRESSSS